ncbi:hypothetical protein K431DRAFT_227147 [Polychaeton citri CBS 116435]|uniref:Transcriptional co-activator n=1 Tax=Polychaeton citri CBS 116435 TaxID=1314669 RepID=A0A9P4UNT8_9PEZI|nr:hypothetical protein K431DRAFT_227147 [Polychaeton citri CBS 116435]
MDPSAFTLTASPALSSKPLPSPLNIAQKNGKAPVHRVDLEPVYTSLKGALADQWGGYKEAVNAFVLGHLNQSELTWVLQPVLSAVPTVVTTNATSSANPFSTVSILSLHNQLISCIFANTQRDPPPSEVASWVVATDKPTTTAKGAGSAAVNDKAEERLKRQVMSLHPRERKRLKLLKEDKSEHSHSGLEQAQHYHDELSLRAQDVGSQSGGGRNNWDLEVRRRYAQPLAAEMLEFPGRDDLQTRIEAICYEQGLNGGTATKETCAELMEQAAEVNMKELLGALCVHARSNGLEAGVQTAGFRRQLRREEADAERGIIQRNSAGLLPVEIETHSKREAISMDDMMLSLQLGDTYVHSDPFLAERILMHRYPSSQNKLEHLTNGASPFQRVMTNGVSRKDERPPTEEPIAVEAQEASWQGIGRSDQDALMGALDDVLAVG